MSSSSWWTPPTPLQLLTTTLLLLVLLVLTLANLVLPRLYRILTAPPPSKLPPSHSTSAAASPTNASSHTRKPRGHLLIILGSGGHTTEMFSILCSLGFEYLDARFNRRTWVVSSGDGFSVGRAVEFEAEMERERQKWESEQKGDRDSSGLKRVNGAGGRKAKKRMNGRETENQDKDVTYTISTVRRARKVHQSLLTTPFSSLGCLWDCIRVLRGPGVASTSDKNQQITTGDNYSYPDLILTNGPGTGVIMVLASLILLFLGVTPITSKSPSSKTKPHNDREKDTEPERRGAMRTIYIESWARVKSLSLSAKILLYMASRVLVQWREVGGKNDAVRDLTKLDTENGDREKSKVGSGLGRERVEWPRKLEYVSAVVT